MKSVWDALINDPDKTGDLKKRSDYLILIQARLNGPKGNCVDKSELLGLSEDRVRNLMNGHVKKFSLKELKAIARKAGVTSRP